MKKILLLSLLITLNANAWPDWMKSSESSEEATKERLPKWMTDVKTYKGQVCTIAYARSSSENPKEEAMLTAQMELGFFDQVKVEATSSNTYAEDKNGKSTYAEISETSKLTGMTSTKELTKLESWTSSKGDYFAIVCQDEKAKDEESNLSKVTTVKLDTEYKTDEINEIIVGIAKVNIEDKLSYSFKNNHTQKIIKKEPPKEEDDAIADFRCRKYGVLAPQWTCDGITNESSLKNLDASIGYADVIDGNLAEAYAKSLIIARIELASNIKASSTHKRFVSDWGDKTSISTRKVNLSIKYSNVLNIWYNQDFHELYVLVGMPNPKTPREIY